MKDTRKVCIQAGTERKKTHPTRWLMPHLYSNSPFSSRHPRANMTDGSGGGGAVRSLYGVEMPWEINNPPCLHPLTNLLLCLNPYPTQLAVNSDAALGQTGDRGETPRRAQRDEKAPGANAGKSPNACLHYDSRLRYGHGGQLGDLLAALAFETLGTLGRPPLLLAVLHIQLAKAATREYTRLGYAGRHVYITAAKKGSGAVYIRYRRNGHPGNRYVAHRSALIGLGNKGERGECLYRGTFPGARAAEIRRFREEVPRYGCVR
ncbi:hypothetical protein GGS23DRAFT_382714 [Durotheca rogersii]|uniref:uncharacterized protein n=1 Tax=Durotheca rogersii TaxID=419775 RepID=UPI00221FE96F|nr:uncharacterized protein GGS23DRAFT_382714 [Durotheca rogersii]KAI5866339.1 hypothetical protein GGS23DRAFT_382714 [Durotheca rogersii]